VYTRCPGCHTVHPVNAAVLAGGAGRYRCGKCNKVSNALESLFDEWPRAGDAPAKAGEVPVLATSIDMARAARSRAIPDDAPFIPDADADATSTEDRPRLLLRLAWITGAILIIAVAAFQWAEFRGEPLFEHARIQSAMIRLGLAEAPPEQPFRDLERIHLVNRELRSHPTLPGRLRLGATIVNRAPQAQPYPDIEVSLLDASGQVLSRQHFSAAEYLSSGSAADARMQPQAYLPLVLDLDDPGTRAVGFELQFR